MPNLSVIADFIIWIMPFAVIGIVLTIWLVCSIIDLFRIQLFEIIKVKQMSLWIERKIIRIAKRMYNKYNQN